MSGAGGHLGERLQDIADHRLSSAELEATSEHLAACARCRRELDALLRVKRALAPQAGHDAVPAELHGAVSQRLARERIAAEPSLANRVRAAANRRWMLGIAFAALLAMAIVLWVLSASGS